MKKVPGWKKNRNCLCYHCSGFHVLFDRNILSVKNGEGKHPVTLQWVVSDEGREKD